ncbi:DUF3016 domain-containing protein [Roseateles chitosanitabidus]|uniref:DUF3016 domain-containing protein n=1 Tax=Roseateles chitosanitabidus TaxID=65048 RepID=UPI000B28930B|nr:DUF3016 domain-containing protein [Roseateles chitosanitabidus]MBO9686182.1 DUF3016 domain-containing protein [Roseateles chitosanitabidus]
MTASKWVRGLRAGLMVLSLGAVAAAAHAQAEVKFIKPENFSDIGDNARDRETAMNQLAEHIKTVAARELPGKQLAIEVTDVDLAGELEPRGVTAQRLRVLRTVTIPRMEFSYTLSENGQVLKSGKASIKDMNYQLSSANRYFESEPLRYEKKMLDDWFAKDLLGKQGIERASR